VTGSELGNAKADPGQIEQVIMNLAVNARDAMPGGGQLTIETRNVHVSDADAAEHLGMTAGPYVALSLTDTGSGMDEPTRARIFEPFYTTKEKGKGTGLGLSTVFGIVQQSGGHVVVESELGAGTTFRVYLPRTASVAEEPRDSSRAPATLHGSETILVAEDDDQVRAVVVGILRRSGYDVLEAQNGGEALLVCEQHADRIHLLVTDVIMPRMSGRKLAERLTTLRGDMRILFMSGYTDGVIAEHGILDEGVSFLQKPITPAALLFKVREALESAR